MNISNTQNRNNNHLSSSKTPQKRLSQEQVRLLESYFDPTKKLDPEHKFRLAREIGVSPRQIAIWYQNKRARWKNQSLELDHGSLQVKLEAALTDKRELQKEVEYLRVELKRMHEMVFGFGRGQTQMVPPVSSLSSGCEEGGGSSSFNDDQGCSGNWINGQDHHHHQFEMFEDCFAKGTSNFDSMPNNNSNYERDFWI